MSWQKQPYLTMLTTIAALVVAGTLDLRSQQSVIKLKAPPADLVRIQSKNADELGVGRLLVASRDLADPHFAKTVVLLVHYDAKGVVGLILNRRTDIPLSHGFKGAKDRSDPVYLGGPVGAPKVFALLQSPAKVEGAEHVFGGVYLISDKTLFDQTLSSKPDPGAFRVYLGCAGWEVDQLRREVELGSWFIFPADMNTVFTANPDLLWSEMIRQTEMNLAGNEPAGASPWTRPSPSVVGD